MAVTAARFPTDWLDPQPHERATDLDLAVLLVNTVDLLENPADRLTDLSWLKSAFSQVGHPELAAQLRTRDLPALRELRDQLRAAFDASDIAAASDVLNPMLRETRAVPLLSASGGLDVGLGRKGLSALSARLPTALAAHIAEHGVRRLGVCQSDPCQCAFVDRTRAGTRRYCCSWCNDRYAARAYRRRKRE